MKWKPDWPQARENFIRWWNREGLVLWLTAPRAEPIEPIAEPARPDDVAARWTDPIYRCDAAEYDLSRTRCCADAFPHLSTQIGPGSLGTFLGAEPEFAETTVWYEPCIGDPEAWGAIRFEAEDNRWLDVHLALIDEALRRADGRYIVGVPDLIENLDTLAALRGTEPLMTDLIERPEWVLDKLREINRAFFASFDLIHDRVRDGDGGNAFIFNIWGPGRTAKVQCDLCCMLSPAMFRRFVVPALTEQCDWLDFSMFHLDGEDALQHLDALLEIGSLDAIEWTPRMLYTGDAAEAGGSEKWWDLYRRILSAGKGVQAICVRPDQVVPMLDALGPQGMYLSVGAPDEAAAEKLLKDVEQFR
ncbi:MAG: hypothetical protein WBF17_27390 [Phycisphaerae bacterium]